MPEIAKIAVDVVNSADRPYDYRIPAELADKTFRGSRVIVPFGGGNRPTEGIVLSLTDKSRYDRLKTVESVSDDEPVMDEEQISLALYMVKRLGCTFFSAAKAMLPAGLWFRREDIYEISSEAPGGCLPPEIETALENGGRPAASLRREAGVEKAELEKLVNSGALQRRARFEPRVRDKTRRVFLLTELGRAALDDPKTLLKSKQRREIAGFLNSTGEADAREIEYYTGAGRGALTSMVRADLVAQYDKPVYRRPETEVYGGGEIELNEEQRAAVDGLIKLSDADEAKTALLFGVTGSGKTEVYISVIRHVLERGKTAIALVPEIALTPQLSARFYHEFGECVAVLHSGLSVGERYDEWRRIRSGGVKVVVGTRSAVFAPLSNVGAVVIDEEHENTFRSESEPRYHTRDIARWRCLKWKALLVLGSATPSIESAWRARKGEYAYFELAHRATEGSLPEVIISDRRAAYRAGYNGCLGPELLELLDNTLRRKEQAILFLNRRGAAQSVVCMECGHVPMCVNCSASLVWHSENGRLMCHQCGYSIKVPKACPVCGGVHLNPVGAGTQSLEAELRERFPRARVLRMDSDTTAGRGAHELMLSEFAVGEADILVGTQMVAKGLNFPNVTLSAVVDADMTLYSGDYKSAERTFSLITQVAGRSGRADKPGVAVIQTSSPGSDVIRAAAKQDYWSFFESESELRKAMREPPFTRFTQYMVSSPVDLNAFGAANRLKRRLEGLARAADIPEAAVLGPAQAPIFKLANRYRYTVTLRAADINKARDMVSGVYHEFCRDPQNRGVRAEMDINI